MPDDEKTPLEHEPRELTGHRVNSCNDSLRIFVMDPPGPGGASHEYQIVNMELHKDGRAESDGVEVELSFQNGAIAEVGTNGITHEVLLAVLIDRLEGFQKGPFACDDNAQALAHLVLAKGWLQKRTAERLARGVEGTLTL